MSLFLSLRSLASNGFERNSIQHRNKKIWLTRISWIQCPCMEATFTHADRHGIHTHIPSQFIPLSLFVVVLFRFGYFQFIQFFCTHSLIPLTSPNPLPFRKQVERRFNKQRPILISAPLYLQQQQQQNGKWSNIHPFNNVSPTYTFIMCCVPTHMKYVYVYGEI